MSRRVRSWARAGGVAGGLIGVAPPAAAAQPETASVSVGVPDSEQRGWSFGVRTGWALPMGKRQSHDDLADYYAGMLPLWLDAGYRLSRRVFVGVYFQYGFLFVSSSFCREPLISCSGTDLRVGGQIQFRLRPGRKFDPWLGVGTGYEVSTLTIHGAEQTAWRSDHGIEFFNLQVGGDLSIRTLSAGPFISFAVGQYETETVHNPAGSPLTVALSSKSLHEFFMFGLRAQYDL